MAHQRKGQELLTSGQAQSVEEWAGLSWGQRAKRRRWAARAKQREGVKARSTRAGLVDSRAGRRGADAGEEAPGGDGSMGRWRPWTGGGHASVPDREKQERGVSGQERQSEGGGEETGRRLLISDEVGAPARPGGRSSDVRRRGRSGSGGARARARGQRRSSGLRGLLSSRWSSGTRARAGSSLGQ